jgi:hypothetical protein
VTTATEPRRSHSTEGASGEAVSVMVLPGSACRCPAD